MPFQLDECIDRLMKKELLAETAIREICEKSKEILMRESNVVHISAPVTVVGDIHGQFYDLLEIFRIGAWPRRAVAQTAGGFAPVSRATRAR